MSYPTINIYNVDTYMEASPIPEIIPGLLPPLRAQGYKSGCIEPEGKTKQAQSLMVRKADGCCDTSQVYRKMKFNIELLKTRSFWPDQEQKWNSSTSKIYFPVLFIPPKNFSSSEKHFHFQPKLNQKSSPMHLHGLSLYFPRGEIKGICCVAQSQ